MHEQCRVHDVLTTNTIHEILACAKFNIEVAKWLDIEHVEYLFANVE